MRSLIWSLLVAFPITSWLVTPIRADVLFDETNLVGLPAIAPPVQSTFTASAAEALTVTLTDLNLPATFSSLQIAVTLNDSLVGSGNADATTHTAVVSVPAAAGIYGLRVIGAPDTVQGVGSFGVCVTRDADPTPRTCVASYSFSGNIQNPAAASTVVRGILSTTFTVPNSGSYIVTLTDDAFPVALSTTLPTKAVILNGSTPIGGAIQLGTPVTVPLTMGVTYSLKAVAVADSTVQAGLYGINIADSTGVSVFGRTIPVGGVASSTLVNVASTQNLTLSLADQNYPAALALLDAAVTTGGLAPLVSLNAAGTAAAKNFPASGNLEVWQFAASGVKPGVYSFNLSSGATSLLSKTQVTNPVSNSVGGSYAFALNIAAGSYQLTATDFQFPSPLNSLSAPTVAQNGIPLLLSPSGIFNAAAGLLVVSVDAQPKQSAGLVADGIFSITINTTATPAQTVFDQTQAVGAIFDTRVINVGTAGSYTVKLADLGFPTTPTSFLNLALVFSQGTQILGKIYGGNKFDTKVTPGQYVLTLVATPGASKYGLYSINIASSPPTVTLTANAATVTVGQAVQLTWSSQNATTCKGTPAGITGWSDNLPLSGTVGIVVTATETLTLTCTNDGGSTAQPLTITATPVIAIGKSGGGGAFDWAWMVMLLGLLTWRSTRSRSA